MLSETGPSTSSAEHSHADDNVDIQALKLLGEGKRNLLVGDAPSAVTSFQEACEILAAKYGETSEQCAESYYNYGNALLELGRMESGVLGNALDGVPDGSATDTDDETVDPTDTIEKPNKMEHAGAGTTDVGDETSGGADGDDGSSDDDSADEDSAVDSSAKDDSANDSGDENKEENPDDIPNFQLAWEMLELARVLFSKKSDKEHMLKVAQVHFKLGELGLETEQYAQSLEDFTKCLDIQKSHLEPESRLIAGSHYNLGLAYTLDNKMEKAMEHFGAAKKIIEDRISKLEGDAKQMEADKEEAVSSIKKEITELQELIPDVLAKYEDAKESKLQPVGQTSSPFDQPSSSSSSAGFSSSSVPVQQIQVRRKPEAADPVSDISHLVRKRKKEENVGSSNAADEPTEAKRTKQEKGDGDAKPLNGNSETGKD